MPLARIDLPAGKPPEYGRAVADVVYDAMTATMNVPADDRFQVISEHTRDALLIDPTKKQGGQPWGQPFAYDLFDSLRLSEFERRGPWFTESSEPQNCCRGAE
jgi:hypothetical protein